MTMTPDAANPPVTPAPPTYAKVRVTLDQPNRRSMMFVVCRDCGAIVFDPVRDAHDDFHSRIPGKP